MMFSKLTILTLTTALAGTAVGVDSSGERHVDGLATGAGDHVARAVAGHLRAQLDWRSYYLDRDAPRADQQMTAAVTWPQASRSPLRRAVSAAGNRTLADCSGQSGSRPADSSER